MEGFDLEGLPARQVGEGLHGLVDHLDDVLLEDLEVGLDGDEVVVLVVFLHDLLVEAVDDAARDDVGVVGGVVLAAGGLERGGVLAEELDVLLGGVARLLDLLGALLGAVGQLLGLVLDLLVQALNDRQGRALDGFLRLEIGVDQRLGVDAHVLEEAGDAAEALVEVISLLKGF